MRILIVNHCHPDIPHVCATRGREFSRALAARGHRVVLLTEALPGAPPSPAAAVGDMIARHDFSAPLALSVAPAGHRLIRRARDGRAPPVFGRAALAVSLLVRGHVFPDWSDGAAAHLSALRRSFEPKVAWGICGNSAAWAIARGAGCPWVLDLKDSWPHFVPAGFRAAAARRFADAAAATAFSHGYAAQLRRWFGREATVVYSGIPKSFLDDAPQSAADDFVVTLTGSVYERAPLDLFVRGMAAWLERDLAPADRSRVRFVYYGADPIAIEGAAPLERWCRVEIPGFRPLAEIHVGHLRAGVNAYTKSARGPFHHKLFELLSAGRPVLCLPGEDAEAESIAARTGGRLEPAATVDQVRSALARAWSERTRTWPTGTAFAPYTWDAQAEVLEGVLARAAGYGR